MSTTQTKASRRQIAAEFKQRSVPRGIFAIHCVAAGSSWVGSSPNLEAVKNSLWFQLRGGLSRHASLQTAWKDNGEAAFTIEVVERFEDDLSPLLLSKQFVERKSAWAAELRAEVL